MEVQYYEEGERDTRSMSLILHIKQGIPEINRVLDRSKGCLIHSGNKRIKVFKHADEDYTRVVFPLDLVSCTAEFGNVLYDLTKSEARGYRSD